MPDFWTPSAAERTLVKTIFEQLQELYVTDKDDLVIWDFDMIRQRFTVEEASFMERLAELDPAQYGVTIPPFELDPVPTDLVPISGEKRNSSADQRPLPTPYLPATTAPAYFKLNKAIQADLGRPLLVLHGYRSPAFQTLLMVNFLWKFEFDMMRFGRRVLPPRYSAHGLTSNGTVDFMTVTGEPLGEPATRFANTEEYTWLQQRGAEFGFKESYPVDNPAGLQYEPWDWTFVGTEDPGASPG